MIKIFLTVALKLTIHRGSVVAAITRIARVAGIPSAAVVAVVAAAAAGVVHERVLPGIIGVGAGVQRPAGAEAAGVRTQPAVPAAVIAAVIPTAAIAAAGAAARSGEQVFQRAGDGVRTAVVAAAARLTRIAHIVPLKVKIRHEPSLHRMQGACCAVREIIL